MWREKKNVFLLFQISVFNQIGRYPRERRPQLVSCSPSFEVVFALLFTYILSILQVKASKLFFRTATPQESTELNDSRASQKVGEEDSLIVGVKPCHRRPCRSSVTYQG